MSNKWFCWEVEVAWEDMEMLGGDKVDGPRWTGRWIDVTSKVVVVSPTDALASAAAVSLFSSHQKASIQGVTKLRDVAAVVQISREAL